MSLVTCAVLAIFLSGCGTTRPCSEAGDLEGLPVVRGDKRCHQKTLPDGKVVNHGQFKQYFASGKLAHEGQFQDGRKSGVWVFYSEETGKPLMERYFNENGIEILGMKPKTAEEAEENLQRTETGKRIKEEEYQEKERAARERRLNPAASKTSSN